MKVILLFICFIFINTYNILSQSFNVYDIDWSSFPTITAKFFAFDISAKQLKNFNPSDFNVLENGILRTVTKVTCPQDKTPQVTSVAMSIDISGSMSYSSFDEKPVELGKTTARKLVNLIAMPPSDFALQTCDAKAIIIQDFTSDKNKILSLIDPILANGDNNFVEHLLNQRTGLLNVAKAGKHRRVAIIYTDAWWYPLTPPQLQMCIDTCNKYNIVLYAIIYSRPESEPNGIKKSLQAIADATGGKLFDGVTSNKAAEDIANTLQVNVQNGEPCEIEWLSEVQCQVEDVNVEVSCKTLGLSGNLQYHTTYDVISSLLVSPQFVRFNKPVPGIKVDSIIQVTAKNSDFNVTNIIANNPAFDINPKSFNLNAGNSINLTVSYLPLDSGYNYCKFRFETDKCIAESFAGGGWKGKKPQQRTLKLIHPNGAEAFVVGTDTVITWEGVGPDEPVKIEYTTNNGINWISVTDNATNFKYVWRIPKTPSFNCLARVTANQSSVNYCTGEEIEICGEKWSSCNLDVTHYRNGDIIPQVSDPGVWANLKIGAWCYYNNDPLLGDMYGKLYNYYALVDPRGLAPLGWHIPSDAEWSQLETCLGGSDVAGGKLKSIGTMENGDGLWFSPNLGASDSFGFSGLPGGFRDGDGTFYFLNSNGFWWSSTQNSGSASWYRYASYNYESFFKLTMDNIVGFSVRCIKD